MNSFKQIAIYGVGLMGASIGLAARQKFPGAKLVGIGRNADRLARASELGCIDEWTIEPPELLAGSDLVILCTPVRHISGILAEVAAAAPAHAIVTDVGSTKATIVAEAGKHFSAGGPMFVGSHPIAGSEQTGAAAARADLFEDACCLVTPGRDAEADTADPAVDRIEAFWQALGARVIVVSAVEHDRLMSLVSHAPHLAAVALIEALRSGPDKLERIRQVCGNGLRDTTRVAAGSAEVWRDICRENKDEIVSALDRVIEELQRLRAAIAADDEASLEAILRQAADYRAGL
ncbi:prephenate dehydrogenase [Candidatus Sumerlaeota bacterium]